MEMNIEQSADGKQYKQDENEAKLCKTTYRKLKIYRYERPIFTRNNCGGGG